MITGEKLAKFVKDHIVAVDRTFVDAISVDVCLGNSFKLELNPPCYSRVVNSSRNEEYYTRLQNIDDGGYFILPENGFAQGITKEYFNMPNNVTGFFYMKSSHARAGFDHSAATLIKPGWCGYLVLELKNNLHYHENILIPGEPIGQVVFVEHDPVSGYHGKFNNQQEI